MVDSFNIIPNDVYTTASSRNVQIENRFKARNNIFLYFFIFFFYFLYDREFTRIVETDKYRLLPTKRYHSVRATGIVIKQSRKISSLWLRYERLTRKDNVLLLPFIRVAAWIYIHYDGPGDRPFVIRRCCAVMIFRVRINGV